MTGDALDDANGLNLYPMVLVTHDYSLQATSLQSTAIKGEKRKSNGNDLVNYYL